MNSNSQPRAPLRADGRIDGGNQWLVAPSTISSREDCCHSTVPVRALGSVTMSRKTGGDSSRRAQRTANGHERRSINGHGAIAYSSLFALLRGSKCRYQLYERDEEEMTQMSWYC
jgi:hypothetical protein